MMTGSPIVSSGKGVQDSGYTAPDQVATHLFPTMAGMVHRTEGVIPDRFSAAVSGPGAGGEALALRFTVVQLEGRRPDEAVQTARSTIHPLFAARALLSLQGQERADPAAPPVNEGRDNNRR